MVHRVIDVDGYAVVVTDPDRRLYGADGPTKAQLLSYYMKMAPRMMPFLRGRPTSAVLLPDESTHEFCFVRTMPPGWRRRFPAYALSSVAPRALQHYLTVSGPRGLHHYLTVPDASALAALIDVGCLSFHPWSSTTVAPRQPTQIVFNLDPEAIAFREVRNAALFLRELLAMCGVTAWVKTSGGQGLHVLVPVSGGISFDDARLVADTIVARAIRREPKLFSRDPRRARRRGRILIDTSRNEPGMTLIAPYAVATSGLVSALIEWDELQRPLYPEDFDMDRVVARERINVSNEVAFFAAKQSVELLLSCKRWPVLPSDGRDPREVVARSPADTSTALTDEAHRLRRKATHLRAETEVTRIESANIRYRAQKAREERRQLNSASPTA